MASNCARHEIAIRVIRKRARKEGEAGRRACYKTNCILRARAASRLLSRRDAGCRPNVNYFLRPLARYFVRPVTSLMNGIRLVRSDWADGCVSGLPRQLPRQGADAEEWILSIRARAHKKVVLAVSRIFFLGFSMRTYWKDELEGSIGMQRKVQEWKIMASGRMRIYIGTTLLLVDAASYFYDDVCIINPFKKIHLLPSAASRFRSNLRCFAEKFSRASFVEYFFATHSFFLSLLCCSCFKNTLSIDDCICVERIA